ncbi:acyl carrier protein [Actinacidiphila soli]|jgi:acyl carrier protein|uniref:acyl carrier protein n=1 Tax=Actinacidiphila soli TaxID=2487275 RepID=UPI000FCB9EC5|nr:acyl carrier protein [Actinacidiphila soli]
MESVYDVMVRQLTEYFGVPQEQISPDATFEEMEVDSLAQVELATMLEDTLGVALPQGRQDFTLGEAAAFLERAAGGEAARSALMGAAK